MNKAQMLEILAQEDAAAKGWETNRKGTTENGQRYIREDIVHAAMQRVRDWAVKECAERVEGLQDAIKAVAE